MTTLNDKPIRIYIASKARHGAEWQKLRDKGLPISSSWIDEYRIGDTADYTDLWKRCVVEASECDALIIVQFHNEEEILKGALVEAGAALAHGKPVYAVNVLDQTFRYHPNVTTVLRDNSVRAVEQIIAAIIENKALALIHRQPIVSR